MGYAYTITYLNGTTSSELPIVGSLSLQNISGTVTNYISLSSISSVDLPSDTIISLIIKSLINP
jgi:hypothetical protein